MILSLPPLFTGLAVKEIDPFKAACEQAILGCDGGLVVYAAGADRLQAAIVFAPEVPLGDAIVMLPVCGVGFQNALGALAPPEVAVHLEWAGGVRVNGGVCGRLRVAASTKAVQEEPDWLVVGLDLTLWPPHDDPGGMPDHTSLYAEGCGEVEADRLLEAWVRHTLVGINRFSDGDLAALHREWTGLVHGIGEETEMAGKNGTFIGVDAQFGMLLRDEDMTHLIPLTTLLAGNP